MTKRKPAQTISFSHPSEEMFARVLDFYGIEWQYEPRQFPLEFDKEGNTTLAFAPDFYLPEQDLFIELTTLRPQLATIKNKKLKLMQERYPEVKVKLLKRREIRGLMVKYGLLDEATSLHGDTAQNNQTGRPNGRNGGTGQEESL